jgi:hypothetical protein
MPFTSPDLHDPLREAVEREMRRRRLERAGEDRYDWRDEEHAS